MGLNAMWHEQEIVCEGIDADETVRSDESHFDIPVRLSEGPTEGWAKSFRMTLGRYDFDFVATVSPGVPTLFLRGVIGTQQHILAAYNGIESVVGDTNVQYAHDRSVALERFKPVLEAAKRIEGMRSSRG